MRINKKVAKKRFEGKCYFCEENRYELLDTHRILEGKDSGTYNWWNMLILCVSHHRMIHSGLLKILGKYKCTNAQGFVIHYEENGEEKFL